MRKRYVTLTASEAETLRAGHQRPPQHQVRNRCQCLLLSAGGQDVAALQTVFGVSRSTVST